MEQKPVYTAAADKIARLLKEGSRKINAGSLHGCLRPIVYPHLCAVHPESSVIITTSSDMYGLYSSVSSFGRMYPGFKKTYIYPEDDSLMYKNIKPSKEASRVRAEALNALTGGEPVTIITDINAVSEKIAPPAAVLRSCFDLKKGAVISPAAVAAMLAENSYERVLKVEEPFEFSVRGSIVDMFPPESKYPLRIEFFGDMIESLRHFSVETNSSTLEIQEAHVFLYNPGRKKHAGESSVLDYLSNNSLIILDGFEALKADINEKTEKIRKYLTDEEIKNNIFPLRETVRKISRRFVIKASSLGVPRGVNFKSAINPAFKKDVTALNEYVSSMAAGGYRVILVSDNSGESKHLKEMVPGYKGLSGSVEFIDADLASGCSLPEDRVCLISNREIFERYKGKVLGKVRDRNVKPVKHYLELETGDYVVHREHGIGVFEGIKTLTTEELTADFMLVRYEGSDKLYLPVDKIGVIDKYTGSDRVPSLSKLGTQFWRRTKEEIQRELKAMAQELLRIFAKREATGGIKYPPDDEAQRDFEEAFVFEETPDQLRAIEEVKADMMKPKSMDRLVCGDAGFGKTEVAMRAAFKAVNAGKQSLLLTATTLLAQQHYFTFSERFADYPVRIEMLSRLTNAAKRKKILQDLKEGKLDIVIGTHAVLASKVEMLNPGLVIIDEEQHFGVKAKENLREKYPESDILTLTATPIPRTLYFSLSGIRDITTINTPPPGKRPVETYIIEERQSTVREIILREILRRGQVFYVHNNVKTIFRVKEELSQALPEVRFRAAHGKMKKTELEKIMRDFLAQKFDVLVTTTIIESGLDLPNVNSIIISSAERFGLSQLYQLKGRVGRRDRQAYAYLMVKDRVMLAGAAMDRLRAIESYADPGAGFQIAMKDLEIRGAGNILGTKQSGNMEKIGFELYCKMLEEAVSSITGGTGGEEKDTKITASFKALIPEGYIWDAAEKLRIYRKIFMARNFEVIEGLEKETADVWGAMPEEARSIFYTGRLKAAGRKLNADEIRVSAERVEISWNNPSDVPAEFVKKLGAYPKVKIKHLSVILPFGERDKVVECLKVIWNVK